MVSALMAELGLHAEFVSYRATLGGRSTHEALSWAEDNSRVAAPETVLRLTLSQRFAAMALVSVALTCVTMR